MNMQNYINQLIEEMREAAKQAPPQKTLDDVKTPEEFEECMEFGHTGRNMEEKTKTLAQLFGIPSSHLPAVEQLSGKQIKTLIEEIEKLWTAYHLIPEVPEKAPDELHYNALRNEWDEEIVYVPYGAWHMDFCDGNCEECQFLEYCDTGKEILSKDRDTNENEPPTAEELFPRYPNEENFIPGIYNYCNRWCEKCKFTDRCRLYADEEAMGLHDEEQKPGREDLAEQLKNSFNKTFQMIEYIAKDMGVDLEEPDEDMLKKEKEKDTRAKEELLMSKAQSYTKNVSIWFTENVDNTCLSEKNGCLSNPEIIEAFEVINWYHIMISAKIFRAVRGAMESEDEHRMHDANGSAKMVLEGLKESRKAWESIISKLPEFENDGLDFINQLIDIEHGVLKKFPEAPGFIRPGIDELKTDE
ncbi:MAG: hypothetical protein K9I68_00570 [Bacteroidales bacterium]|nr:hypothetical protein [Bacteroidales bacterium]MCF8339016.1 hypothetical protein [Bacteroidales bacterium]